MTSVPSEASDKFHMSAGEISDPDLAFAGARAHNRFLVDLCSDSPERRAGIALVPICHGPERAVEEIEWVAQHPGIEGPDPIDKGGDALDPMLGDHRRHPELGHQPEHDLQHVLGRLWVELGGWLIEDERIGMHGHCRGDGYPLAFAPRQGIDPAAPQRVDPDLIDHLLDALAHQRSR